MMSPFSINSGGVTPFRWQTEVFQQIEPPKGNTLRWFDSVLSRQTGPGFVSLDVVKGVAHDPAVALVGEPIAGFTDG